MASCWHRHCESDNVSTSGYSHNTHQSIRTQSTVATEYSYRMTESRDTKEDHAYLAKEHQVQPRYAQYDERISNEIFDSRQSSDQDNASEIDVDGETDVFPPAESPYAIEAITSTPRTFADHFPTDNRIFIRHDNSSLDGNMNLRLETLVPTKSGTRRPMTLFHLRMYDLRSRDFSLRRYCRDSGREVCRSEREYQHTPTHHDKLNIQKSLCNAFASLKRQNSNGIQQFSKIARAHTGYSSSDDDDDDDPVKTHTRKQKIRRVATNTINLEFSNYAHVDMKRQGRGSKKCYNFEYWGVKYSWRRHIKQDGDFKTVSFHLYKNAEKLPSAHIVPDALTRQQAMEEQECGGWISQSSLWIKDTDIDASVPDVADVVLATGVIALVDNTIKTAWPRRTRPFIIPLLNLSSSSPPASQHSTNKAAARNLIDTVFSRPQNIQRRQTSLATTPYASNRRRLTQ